MSLADNAAPIGHNLRDELSIEIEEALAEFEARFAARSGEAERAFVTDDDSAGRAATLAKVLADISKGAERRRVEIKEPYLAASRKIDGAFVTFIESVETVRKKVIGLIGAYQRELERRALEERQRLAREAEEKEAAARDAEAAGRHVEAARLESQASKAQAQSFAPPESSTIRSSYGQTASARTEWKFEVFDRTKLPMVVTSHPKVIEAQNAVIASLVRSGTREIAGCRIYSQKTTVVKG